MLEKCFTSPEYRAIMNLRIDSMKTNAVHEAFHEKFWFGRIGRLHKTGYKNGAWHNISWFEKNLQDQIDYLQEKVKIPEKVLVNKTGQEQPEFSEEQKRRLASPYPNGQIFLQIFDFKGKISKAKLPRISMKLADTGNFQK